MRVGLAIVAILLAVALVASRDDERTERAASTPSSVSDTAPPPDPADDPLASLFAALEGDDADERRLASRKLRKLGARAIPGLVAILRTGSPEARLHAARTLGRLRPRTDAVVPPLLEAAASADAALRLAAVDALARLTDPRAVAVFGHALSDPDDEVAVRAAEGLEALGEHAAPALLQLLAFLKSGRANRAAIEAIGAIGPAAAPAVPDLIEVVKADGEHDLTAIEALGAIGPAARAAVPLIVERIIEFEEMKERQRKTTPHLHVSWAPVGITAREALVGIGADSVAALVARLGHETWGVRYHAMQALLGIGTTAVPVLRAAARHDDAVVRKHVAEIFGALADDHADLRPVLERMLRDADEGVRAEAAEALGRFGAPALPALVRALADPAVAAAAAAAIAALGSDAADAVPDLTVALASPEREVRARAATALAAIGPASAPAARALGQALADPEVDVRKAATAALAAIGAEAVPALVTALGGRSVEARAAAADALARLRGGDDVVVPALEAQLDAPDVGVRAAIALAQRGRSAERAIPVLVAGLALDRESDLVAVERLADIAGALAAYDATARHALSDLIAATARVATAAFPNGFIGLWAQSDFARVRKALAKLGRHDVPTVAALLKDEGPVLPGMAERALAEMGALALPHVAAVARSGTPGAAARAVRILGKLADAEGGARDVLRELLAAPKPEVRVEASRSYWKVTRDAELLVPVLLDVIRSDAPDDVRQTAGFILANRIGSRAAFAIKDIRAARTGDQPGMVRYYLDKAIKTIENG